MGIILEIKLPKTNSSSNIPETLKLLILKSCIKLRYWMYPEVKAIIIDKVIEIVNRNKNFLLVFSITNQILSAKIANLK